MVCNDGRSSLASNWYHATHMLDSITCLHKICSFIIPFCWLIKLGMHSNSLGGSHAHEIQFHVDMMMHLESPEFSSTTMPAFAPFYPAVLGTTFYYKSRCMVRNLDKTSYINIQFYCANVVSFFVGM